MANLVSSIEDAENVRYGDIFYGFDTHETFILTGDFDGLLYTTCSNEFDPSEGVVIRLLVANL